MENRFDVVIIGSGIGGLICGNLLAREGLRVCVLEKNKQIGGALQTFSRDKVLFDSGVHYIGGRTLYQVFQYLGIVGALGLLPMDGEAFDKILIEGEDKAFALAPGYERFEAQLCADFPGEEGAIQKYIAAIREVCERFPLYHLRREATGATGERRESDGERHGSDADPAHWSADAFIRSLTDNPTLQAVLAGNNILYAGQGDKTPFYVHALILNSYIEESWKCPDGGSKISGALAKNIRALGGQVRTSAPVRRIVEENGQITHVELEDGSTVGGTHFVSNMHPVTTLGMTDSPLIKKAYRNRMESLENSVSAFCVNVVLKPGSFPYENHNYYYHRKGSLWRMTDYQPEEWPLGYALFMAPSPDEGSPRQGAAAPHPGPFAQSLTLMTFMKYEDVLPWKDTFNTVSAKASRGADYDAFKKEKATRLLALAAEKFPRLPDAIQAWYAATPLSYRDYLGTADGAIYGIVKDYTDLLKTTIAPRTKIPNLYLTGQNLHLHGILGSAISALVTGVAILGKDDLIEKKIGRAHV